VVVVSAPFRTRRRVEFSDTDAIGIAHFTSFFRWMEEAEHDFWRSMGLSVVQSDELGMLSWPRGSAECRFERPARFEDEIDIDVRVVRLGSKSATFQFEFLKDGQRIALGTIAVICCRVEPGKPMRSVNVPADVRRNLESAMAVGPASEGP
jgi:YbgC/YbaW family acyl-CoA thioester hydrolase